MNYLAHLHLGGPSEAQQLGSLLGDFVKGPLKGEWPKEVEQAIALHRRLDVVTDQHPAVQQAKYRFEPAQRRMASIALDIFFDHCLARHWSQYAQLPLPDFVEQVYQRLQSQPRLPPRLQAILPHMVNDNWLLQYQYFEQLFPILKGLERRLSQRHSLTALIPTLRQEYDQLTDDFHWLYPELIATAKQWRPL